MEKYNNGEKPNFTNYKHAKNNTEFAQELGANDVTNASSHKDKRAKQKSGRKMASIKGK